MDTLHERAYTSIMMKTFLSAFYVIVLGTWVPASGLAQQTNNSATAQLPRLYLHVFSTSIGMGTNGFYEPSMLILSTNIYPGEAVEKRWLLGGPSLLVRIEIHDGKYFLHKFSGMIRGMSRDPEYQSQIELEKPFWPASRPMPEADIDISTIFVLSTNSNYEPFLESLRAEASRIWAPRLPDPAFKSNVLLR